MLAILIKCLDKPVHAKKRPDFGFQIWFFFEWEYVEVYQGFGGLAPKVTGFRE